MKINPNIPPLLFVLFFISSFVFLVNTCSNNSRKKNLEEYARVVRDGKKTVGTVISVYKNCTLSFEVNSIRYTTSRHSKKYIKSLEQFEVVYDSLDPNISYPLFYRPITLFESNFEKTKSIEIIDLNQSSTIEFSYKVEDEILYRYAEVPPELRKLDIYDKTKNYLVKYYKDRPSIAYIYLDSVVNSK
ncbi:hypothetical protein V9L05_00450 [Bernardetia sp. Wsw4-3y2]|uniref:hypothetical protein n=1 Tax=Bernardetia sp. Wsw4-3y2 TaxID=3127471 RepID=UPI0030CEB4FC